MSEQKPLLLGLPTDYVQTYSPLILQAIPRELNRQRLVQRSFVAGADVWHGYEVSWLTKKGKPVVATLVVEVPCDSEAIVESKSFKLYLNSLNQHQFSSAAEVERVIATDMQRCLNCKLKINLQLLGVSKLPEISQLQGLCIDELDVDITQYQLSTKLLTCDKTQVAEQKYHSHLLKSNCPVTNQPDWGSVQINLHGALIDPESLLAYLVSFRQSNDFHEHCVEQIFNDITQLCQPQKLLVAAYYLRRGGLDINPWRANYATSLADVRLLRQ